MRRAFNGTYGITRRFGVVDPAYSNYPGSRHPGTDYGTPSNTPLVANQSGTVTVYNRDPNIKTGRGKEVVITNGAYQTKACHMNRIDVANGQQVVEGQPIGLSGYTGYVVDSQGNVGTPGGAHLHNELLINGQYVNLEDNLKPGGQDVATNAQIDEWISTQHYIAFGTPATQAVFDSWRPVLKNNFADGSISILKGIDGNAGALKNKPTGDYEKVPYEVFKKK